MSCNHGISKWNSRIATLLQVYRGSQNRRNKHTWIRFLRRITVRNVNTSSHTDLNIVSNVRNALLNMIIIVFGLAGVWEN